MVNRREADLIAREQVEYWLSTGVLAKQAIGILRPHWTADSWHWKDVAKAVEADWIAMQLGGRNG